MPKKKRQWEKELSPTAKAELLASVIHLFSEHMPKLWAKTPEWFQRQLQQVMNDCSIEAEELSAKDIRLIHEYVTELEAKHPRPDQK